MSTRSDGKPHYWPYTTPKAKRELAASYRKLIGEYGNPCGMDPDFWDALATLQEQDRVEEWQAILAEWEATKPHPTQLLAEKPSNPSER